jgi:hypothetical protein
MIETKAVQVTISQSQKVLGCDGCGEIGRREADERVSAGTFAEMTQTEIPEGWTVLKYRLPFQNTHHTRRVDLCAECSKQAFHAVGLVRK